MTEKFDPERLGRMYATPDVIEQRARTRAALEMRAGESFLDVGSGPGYLTCEVAGEVGAGGRCVGVDLSEAMLDAARSRARDSGVEDRVAFLRGDAVDLPVEDGSFDAVAVVQVLEYVPDLDAAFAEFRRVLRPGGRLVIVDTDWRSCVWHSDDRDRTDAVLRLWEEHFVHPHLPPRLPVLLPRAGFARPHVDVVPIVNAGSAENTYSTGILELIAAFVGQRDAALAEQWAADVRAQSAAGTYFFSLCRYQFATHLP